MNDTHPGGQGNDTAQVKSHVNTLGKEHQTMPGSGQGVIKGNGEANVIRRAAHKHSPRICNPEYAMGPDHTHIGSVDGSDTRFATSYGLQSPQSPEK